MKRETLIVALAPLVGVLTAAGVYGVIVKTHRAPQSPYHVPSPTRLAASPEIIIGSNPSFQGNATAPYTLVEFGDYQCPPCRQSYFEVKKVQGQYPNKLRFVFRNMPLERIHPFAEGAALAAESAKAQGKFWEMHDALYEDSPRLSASDINAIVTRLSLNKTRYRQAYDSQAREEVSADLKAAHAIEVRSTPTFIVCCPNRKVIKLGRLNQLKSFMSQN